MKLNSQCPNQLVDKQQMIAILDDFFPNLLTAFRVAEYNWYLECFPQVSVYSANPDFEKVHAEYAKLYPQYANRVKQYTESCLDDCAFVYMNFLNNAYHFLPAINAHRIPFLMTLYPGGGFGLNEPESDEKLEQVLASPLLRGIISTQNITADYLKAKGCTAPVHDIYGVAVNTMYFEDVVKNEHASLDSGVISICFVAERYMPQGANKGYPQFIEAAAQLIRGFPNLQFSVVGSFDADDFPLDDVLKKALTFKGVLTTQDLKEFFQTQDIIISPNRPFLLHSGNFDGFPTGCCVEASLCGVAVVCSDELKLNRYYTDGVDIVICEPVSETIVTKVSQLIRNPDLLKQIGERGQRISQTIFDPKRQLGQRSALLINVVEHNEEQWSVRDQQITELKQTIADQAIRLHILADPEQTIINQAKHIKNIAADWVARGKLITQLEQMLADQTNHIQSVEADRVVQEERIKQLEQTIANQTQHIQTIEAELMKFQSSLYGKSISGLSRLLKTNGS